MKQIQNFSQKPEAAQSHTITFHLAVTVISYYSLYVLTFHRRDQHLLQEEKSLIFKLFFRE